MYKSRTLTLPLLQANTLLLAGVFGGLTASRKILYIQALPAALALLLVYLS